MGGGKSVNYERVQPIPSKSLLRLVFFFNYYYVLLEVIS